jgi:hypothetical protein
MVRSDYKIWVQTEGSSVLTCCHIDLWLRCGSHLVIFISNKSHLFIILPKMRKLSLPVGCQFSLSMAQLAFQSHLSAFPLSAFGCSSHSPASPPDYHKNHKNHLTKVDSSLVVPLGFLGFHWLSSATAHTVQPPCLTTTRTILSKWTRAW